MENETQETESHEPKESFLGKVGEGLKNVVEHPVEALEHPVKTFNMHNGKDVGTAPASGDLHNGQSTEPPVKK